MSNLAPLLLSAAAAWQTPTLEIPQAGLDDPDAYEGHATRFFRDSSLNAFQIYINASDGRLVHVWADAGNASAAFTARGADGSPAQLTWDSSGVIAHSDGPRRVVKHRPDGPAGISRRRVPLSAYRLGT